MSGLETVLTRRFALLSTRPAARGKSLAPLKPVLRLHPMHGFRRRGCFAGPVDVQPDVNNK